MIDPPAFAAFRHDGAGDGFEVVFFRPAGARLVVEGTTAAVEDGEPYAVVYRIELDDRWRCRTARVSGQSASGVRTVDIEADGEGHWRVDSQAVPELDGCLDLDLESSSATNAFPVRRLGLEIGESADAPAAYVRELDLRVERLEQHYARIGDDRFAYDSPGFDFHCELVYDASGIVTDYPGIATRFA